MRRSLLALATALACAAGAASAQASSMFGYDDFSGEHSRAPLTGKRHSQRDFSNRGYSDESYGTRRYARRQAVQRSYTQRRSYGTRTYASAGGSLGGRPRAWCGWWMRTQLGGGPEYNLAANWRNYGRASGPQIGAVVVWPHHVGIITGRTASGQWIVKSGNDGNAVRERAQSVAGAVFRVG